MKIIEKGNNQNQASNIYKTRCKHCGCVFNYSDDDIQQAKTGTRTGVVLSNGVFTSSENVTNYVHCPQCGKIVKITNKKPLIVFIVACVICIFSIILTFSVTDCSFNKEHHCGEYQCPHCGSFETSGFSTFWYRDGTLVSGSKEYQLENADYTIMSCDHCGKSFKIWLR